MFRTLRKSNLQMTDEEALALLAEGEYAIISVMDPKGFPYGFPMSYVLMDGNVYYHGSKVGHKTDCLNYNDQVCLTVVGKTELRPELLDTDYESVVAFGIASEAEGEEKKQALVALVNKYATGYEAEGLQDIEQAISRTSVVKIELQHIIGKKRQDRQR